MRSEHGSAGRRFAGCLAGPSRARPSRPAAHASAALVVLGALLAVVLPGCLGCGSSLESPEASGLRAAFPAVAAEVLEQGEGFAQDGEGFASAAPVEASAGAGRALRAFLPRAGDGEIRFRVEGASELRVREVGASGEGALGSRALSYAREGGRSFWTGAGGRYEEWLLLRPEATAGEGPVAVWQVAGGTARQRGEAVELDLGGARIRVTASRAYAASGRALHPRLAARGATLELFVDAGGEAALVDPSWELTAPMGDAPQGATATLLEDGTVLVAGGDPLDQLQNAALYEQTSDTWTSTRQMQVGRSAHTATRLPDGTVLVAGGADGSGNATATAEIYDPKARTWTPTGSLAVARVGATATLLAGGGVLVAGGAASTDGLPNGYSLAQATAELYDAHARSWALAGAMMTARWGHTATALDDGRVLVAGGDDDNGSLASAELYDPAAGTWTPGRPMREAREAHSATLLPGGGGEVLVAGGTQSSGPTSVGLATAERYRPATGAWAATGSMTECRSGHSATLLPIATSPQALVLVAGGDDCGLASPLTSAERYDPATGRWTPTPRMNTARAFHTATLLPPTSGEPTGVLVTGGASDTYVDAEIYRLSAGGAACATAADCDGTFPFCAPEGVCCIVPCTAICASCTNAKTGKVDGYCGFSILEPTAIFCQQSPAPTEFDAQCNTSGQLVTEDVTPCAPYGCSPDGVRCAPGCDDQTPCAPASWCFLGTCLPQKSDGDVCTCPGSLCDQCVSGLCVSGLCAQCRDASDCAAGSACDLSYRCVPPGAPPVPAPGGGTCGVAPEGGRSPPWPLLVLASLALGRRRRGKRAGRLGTPSVTGPGA